MNTSKFKMESGIQLLARLNKKTEIRNFYPNLFKSGPRQGDIIEMFSDTSTSVLVADIICEALIPVKVGGVEAGVLVFDVDGNFNYDYFINLLRRKLICRLKSYVHYNIEPDSLLHETLCNFHIVHIYDVSHYYTTIHNLENILIDHSNISLIIFDTLTAFYWSEQSFKITKMDLYIKNLLHIIQKVTKEHKNVIVYTRPEYFSSTNDVIHNLEPCCEHPTHEQLNYRIQVNMNQHDERHTVNIISYNDNLIRQFQIINSGIQWLNN